MRRGPWRLTAVTNPDECNLACAMCAEHAPEAREASGTRRPPRRLSLPQVTSALDGAPDGLAELIPSTRGEPLVWDALPALASLCRARGLRLNVTTNGTFPGAGAERWSRVLVPACRDVKVSWGAADPVLDRVLLGGRDPARALADLETLLRVRDEVAAGTGHRCGVSLQVAAREENVGGLPAVVRLAARLGVDRVKVNQLQARVPSLHASRLASSPAGIARWNEAVAACREAAAREARDGGPVTLQGVAELPEDGALPAGDCPFVGREAWLEVDGRWLPCPSPAARAGALGDFGRLAEVSLGEAWDAPAWRGIASGWRGHPACVDCSFRRPGGA